MALLQMLHYVRSISSGKAPVSGFLQFTWDGNIVVWIEFVIACWTMNTTVKFLCLVAAATQLVTFAHAGLASAVAKNRYWWFILTKLHFLYTPTKPARAKICSMTKKDSLVQCLSEYTNFYGNDADAYMNYGHWILAKSYTHVHWWYKTRYLQEF